MSHEEIPKPTLQAGKEIIDQCPVCHAKFSNKVPSNVKHKCPNPNCLCEFTIMVFDD